MPDPRRIKRTLLSLQHASLRVDWLRDELERTPDEEAARLLDALIAQGAGADLAAREALLTVALLFASACDGRLVQRLRHQAREQRLFALERLLPPAPSSATRASPAGELPVPDYGAGRELTLGERRSLARRPDRSAFEKLLLDPHPLVIRQVLANPRMTEEDALRLAARRPAREAAIRELARAHRWLQRPRIRLAIVLNPGSPPGVTVPLLGLCTRSELAEVVRSTDTPVLLRATAHELLSRCPPVRERPGDTQTLH